MVDKKLLTTSIIVLLIEVTLLLGDLGLLNIKILNTEKSQSQNEILGKVNYINKKLRKKSQDSIIWENANEDESLYLFDSILTLKNSSAEVKLKNNTNLKLEENTLVVLEPVDVHSDSNSIRLKFKKGGINFNSGESSSSISSDDITIDVTPNTDLNVVQLENKKIQVEVSKGSAFVPGENKTNIQPGEIIVFNENKVEDRFIKNQSLNWKFNGMIQRIYSHSLPQFIELKWEGEPTEILITKSGNNQESIKIPRGSNNFLLAIDYGTFHLNLKKENTLSPTLTVNHWISDKIKYFSPLPRDRVDKNLPQLFSFSPSEQVSQYFLEFSYDQNFQEVIQREQVSHTLHNVILRNTGAIYWRIFGHDDLGFRIPSSEVRILHSLENPLSAPQLMSPKMRLPSSINKKKKQNKFKKETRDNSNIIHNNNFKSLFSNINLINFISQIFIQEAYAQEKKSDKKLNLKGKLIFSWLPVENAKFYNIEISSTPDFKNLIVTEKVSHEEFNWTNFEMNTFYWRVAAESADGLLGLFSKAEKIDINELLNSNNEFNSNVEYVVDSNEEIKPDIKKIEVKENLVNHQIKNIDTQKTEPKINLNIEDPRPDQNIIKTSTLEQYYEFRFGFNFNYLSRKYSGINDLVVDLNGWSTLSTQIKINIPQSNKGHTELNLATDYYEFSPKFQNLLPFQNNLTFWESDIEMIYFWQGSPLGIGIKSGSRTLFEKEQIESIINSNNILAGLLLSYKVNEEKKWYSELKGSILNMNNINEYSLKAIYDRQARPWDIDFFYGIDASYSILNKSTNEDYHSFGFSFRWGVIW